MGKLYYFMVVLLCVTSSLIYAKNGILPGIGTEADPYLIEDLSDFQSFCQNTDYWSENVYTKLIADIDLNGQEYVTALIAPDPNYLHRFDGIAYAGTFLGNSHTISSFNITSPAYIMSDGYMDIEAHDYFGLFGMISVNGKIRDLTVSDFIISGNLSSFSIGGLCGENNGAITNCHTHGTVTGKGLSEMFGGLCGTNNGDINTSFSTGSIESNNYQELIGKQGGFCGDNSGFITNCYTTCSVSCDSIHAFNIGGFCGDNSGTISKCYSTGQISINVYMSGNIGGFCGYNSGTLSAYFWDAETSGIGTPGSYLTPGPQYTIFMQSSIPYSFARWDFNAETASGSEDIWHMPWNATGYPMLYWQRDIPGDYTGGYGVDITDAAVVASGWLSEYDIADLQTLVANWLAGK